MNIQSEHLVICQT